MDDIIITGASRGIGAALAETLARPGRRLIPVARSESRLREVAARVEARGGAAEVVAGDLSTLASARELGERLVDTGVGPDAILVHNAGLWPSRRETGPDGLERAFVVNYLGPWLMQKPLLRVGVRRIFVVSAGLLIKGRYDPARTPTGADFSAFRTYCTTKLCFAVSARQLGRDEHRLDVAVVHPGVVRTELGARGGVLGWLLARIKRGWESPASCAERLALQLASDPWSPPGDPGWWVEGQGQPWPEVSEDPDLVASLSATLSRYAPPPAS